MVWAKTMKTLSAINEAGIRKKKKKNEDAISEKQWSQYQYKPIKSVSAKLDTSSVMQLAKFKNFATSFESHEI